LHIPTLYLEGYKELVTTINVLPWPKKPRAIFTSNSYMTDDLFKAWAAEKIENRVPLIIGQHGGQFGMTPFSFHEEHQIAIADKWLSWGWKDLTRENIIPIGNLRSSGRSVKCDPDGGILMVETSLPRYSCHLLSIPISGQYLDYLEDQMLFLKELPHQLQKEVLLKLYSVNYGWDEVERWRDRMPEIKVDLGCNNIEELINKCRIYVSTYNATTYLESLIWNIPTIIFLNPKHWELIEDVRPYFELLESVGIFHKTPQSAAQQMVKVWDNVSGWWEASEVQSAREKFCYQFSRELDATGSDLQSIFKKIKPI
jgi:putative transferase (TIGR04331 family)